MTRRPSRPLPDRGRRAAVLLAVLALAGCGGGHAGSSSPTTTSPPTTATGTAAAPATLLRLYFLRNGVVAPVAREIPATPAVARAAVEQLLAGPGTADGSVGSAFLEGTRLRDLSIANGVASARFSQRLPRAAQAQVVYTLTAFPTVSRVRLGGAQALTRADFERLTPPILVESPLPGQIVTSPIRVRGTANTFEATFQASVLAADGRALASETVTATSGPGRRGTFDVAIPVQAPPGPIRLVVFDASAADGSHLHQVEIPLLLR